MPEKPIPLRGDQIDLEDAIAAAPAYSDELVTLYRGDCLEVLRNLPDMGVDAIVTDPPAGIDFMGKGWDSDRGGRDVWVAWMRDVMLECLRVLKPGAHALVWAIPRTSHWTATAVEDAGFEVRDVITHHFGSGFPKSLDVSKAIDKSTVRDRETAELKFRGFMDDIYRVTAFIREARDKAGKSNADIDALFGFVGMAGHWTSSKSQPAIPQWEQWLKLKDLLACGDSMDVEVWRLNGRKGTGPLGLEDTAYAEREITGQHERAPAAQTWKANYGLDADLEAKERRDVAATAAAAEWQGWGTALKPASEHWILARRPLSETNVAANVLKHGTGALNIDGCRIGDPIENGRWPANLALSHSDACGETCTVDCPVGELDRQSGEAVGGASRFFFVGVDKSWNVDIAASNSNQPNGAGDSAPSDAVTRLSFEAERGPVFPELSMNDTARALNKSAGSVTQPTPNIESEFSRESVPSNTAGPGSHVKCAAAPRPTVIMPTTTSLSNLSGSVVDVTSDSTSNSEELGAPAFASRFMYTAKASPSERNAGLDGMARTPTHRFGQGVGSLAVPADRNTHPTVKSTDLMRWLCRLITPRRGTVLDPFMGSGSTGVAAKLEDFHFIGIEREEEYMEIAKRRLGWAVSEPELFALDDVNPVAA